MVLEKTLESLLDSNEIKLVNPKGHQSWILIRRTDAEAEAPILWPSDGKSLLIGKEPDAGKDWMQEEKGMTEDEMVGWYHQLNDHEFWQTLGDSEGWGSLACWSSWSHKESNTVYCLNNNNNWRKPHILWFPLHDVSRISKFTETQSRLVISKTSGEWASGE